MVEWLLVPLVVLAAVTWWLARDREVAAIVYWNRSWFFLFAVAALLVLTDGGAPTVALTRLLAPFFPAMTLAGALVYAGRRVPGWLIPAAFGLGVLRLGAFGFGLDALDYGIGLVFEPTAVLAAARLVWPASRAAERWTSPMFLAPIFALVAGVEAADSISGLFGVAGLAVHPFAWALVAPAAIMVQIRVARAGMLGRERRAGQAASDSAARFRALTENAFDLITEMDQDGRVTYANPRCEALFGVSSSRLLGAPMLDWVHPNEREPTRAWFRALRNRGCDTLLTCRVRHRDGSWRWVEVSGRTFQSCGDLRIVANYRDASERVAFGERLKRVNEDLEESVSRRTVQLREAVANLEQEVAERKRIERQLRSSEERWRNVSNLSSDLSFSLIRHADGSLTTEWVTEAITRMTGRTREEIEERGWGLVTNAADMENSVAQLTAIAVGETREYDGRLMTLLGKERWVRFRITCAATEAPGKLRILGAGIDMTDSRRAEEERRQLEAHLQKVQKLESLGILAGGVAHDFNNLLAVILGNSGLALADSEEGSALAVQLERIRSAARHAEALTSQMLTYSGKASVSLKPLDLSKLVDDMAELLRAAVSKKCQLDFTLAHGKTVVEGDPTQIRQVIMNLVTNASESLCDRTGRVVVRTGLMSATDEYVSDTFGTAPLTPGRFVFFEVSDPGGGVDPEIHDRIFEPFFSTKFTGRGLGLATVLGIVRGHGGAIKVTSEVGSGTRMRVLFPPAEGAVNPREATAPAGRAALRNGTVLVVDDNEAVLDLTRELLIRSGLGTVPAAGGREALAILTGEGGAHIDAVVLDLAMPDLDGWETLVEIRRIRPGLPVVIVSGYGETSRTDDLRDDAVAAFVRKPYEPETLVDAVRGALAD